jgi:ribonuclease E
MAIRKDGSQLSPNDERNTGLSREGDLSQTSRVNENDDPDTQNVSSGVEEGDEDYDDEELDEEDFDVDEDDADDDEEDDEDVE